MMKVVRPRRSWMLVVLVSLATVSLGGKCGGDGGAPSTPKGGTAGATCAEVCACMASTCPEFPFAPDCVTACGDTTTSPPWDLACRANECAAAKKDHDPHCTNASGQT